MSHSQFRRVKTYTETCMDESLRQAYDYWQDQPGSVLQHSHMRRLQTFKLRTTRMAVTFNVTVGFANPPETAAPHRALDRAGQQSIECK